MYGMRLLNYSWLSFDVETLYGNCDMELLYLSAFTFYYIFIDAIEYLKSFLKLYVVMYR